MRKLFKPALVAIVLCLAATASSAENWGIRFDQMPVGTEFEVKHQNGDRFVSRFVGKQGRFYILEETNLKYGRKVRQKFNANGHFVSVTGPSGLNIKRFPHGCSMVIGPCSHFVSGTTKHSGKYVYNIKQLSATKRIGTWRRIVTEESRSFKQTIGKYNIVILSEFTNGSRKLSRTVTRISEPGG